jgi:hypothetical protein
MRRSDTAIAGIIRRATLGLDLYLLWRTLATIGRKRD